MEIVIVIALAYGVLRGVEYGGRRVASSFQARRSQWAQSRPGRAMRWGANAAAAVTTGVLGAGLASAGFVAGFPAGWREGKLRAQRRWMDNQATPQQVHPPQEDNAPAEKQIHEQSDKTIKTEPIEQQEPEGTKDMAIDTATGGEVVTLEQARAECEAILREATADLDDAQADAQRAGEDHQRVELFAASLRAGGFGVSVTTPAEAMLESADQRRRAALDRSAAADSRASQARALLVSLRPHEDIRDLAQATDGMADRSVYA